MLADPTAADLLGLLAGACAALEHSDVDPGAVCAVGLAFDALVDPLAPQPPSAPPAVDDPLAAAGQARSTALALLEEDRPVAELFALADAARHLEEALRLAGAPAGGR